MKRIIRVGKKKELEEEARIINKSLKDRKIKREAYVCSVSKSYVKKLTRKGYPVAEKNYAICVRNKR